MRLLKFQEWRLIDLGDVTVAGLLFSCVGVIVSGEFTCIIAKPSSRGALGICSTPCRRLSYARYLRNIGITELLLSSRNNWHFIACGVTVSFDLLAREIIICNIVKYIQICGVLTTWSSSLNWSLRILVAKDRHNLRIFNPFLGDRWSLESILGNPTCMSNRLRGSTNGLI